jgi:hypothetical protein
MAAIPNSSNSDPARPMTIKYSSSLIAIIALGLMPVLGAEGTAKAATGNLMLEKKAYPLKHAVAYQTKIDDEDAIAVVLSGPAVSNEKLKEAREAEKDGGDGDFSRPFLKLIFSKAGELKFWSAGAGSTSIGRRSGEAKGDLKVQGRRVSGKASQPLETEGMFPSGFDAQFDTALLQADESLPDKKHGPAANVKPTVSGIFKGNGKEAKLAHMSARWGEPFNDKPGIVLVFTEKDHSQAAKPDLDASFGKFGSALIISLHEDGQIYGCEVVHSAHQKRGFSSIGNLEATDFDYENGKVEGELTTNGQVDTFGETWEVKLRFAAPLGETPKELQPAASNKSQKGEKEASSDSEGEIPAISGMEDDDENAPKPAAGGLKARDLALTADASEVDFKALAQQISFKSKADVKKVCAELTAGLAAQGWTREGQDMVQSQSSILRRKRGGASLTIFVKPSNGGSEVKMMSEGLAWE